MVWKIKWSEEALNDLNSIRVYIQYQSFYYAEKCVNKILSETRRLENFPRLGRGDCENCGNKAWKEFIKSCAK